MKMLIRMALQAVNAARQQSSHSVRHPWSFYKKI
jgi:hypothetical protein